MITTDRNQFVGFHVRRSTKRALRIEAAKQGKSLSQFISDILEAELERRRTNDAELTQEEDS